MNKIGEGDGGGGRGAVQCGAVHRICDDGFVMMMMQIECNESATNVTTNA
jgi:hypothetical protein